MIKYLTRNQIDVTKYDACILKSINSRVYGYSWYLDVVCDSWDALVLDDYSIVMPLPKRKKYGLNYIYLASWVQQLGVFSEKKIESNLLEQFIQKIPKKFKLIDMMLNTANSFSSKYISTRHNFVLSLKNKSHQLLQKQYSKGRKSNVRQAQKLELVIRTSKTANDIIELFEKNKGAEAIKTEQEYFKLQNLVLKGLELDKVNVYEVLNKNKKLTGGAIFLKDKNRITYLFSALNDEGREKQAMSFLIDFVIKKYANKPVTLDFEGSMIPEIASFYKSFGAEKEIYFQYKKWQLL